MRAPSRGPPSRGPSRGPGDRPNNDRSAPDKELSDILPTHQLAPPSPGNRPHAQPMRTEDDGGDDLPPNWEMAFTPEGHMYFIELVHYYIALFICRYQAPLVGFFVVRDMQLPARLCRISCACHA